MSQDYPQLSSTYKLKADGVSDHAMYFIIVGDPPVAFFLNSKEMNSFEQMKEVFSPNGSYFIPGGIKVNSIVHHLGLTLEKHIDGDV